MTTTHSYTRDDETFTIGTDTGLRYLAADGQVLINRPDPLPHDVVAATVLELLLAGWAPLPT